MLKDSRRALVFSAAVAILLCIVAALPNILSAFGTDVLYHDDGLYFQSAQDGELGRMFRYKDNFNLWLPAIKPYPAYSIMGHVSPDMARLYLILAYWVPTIALIYLFGRHVLNMGYPAAAAAAGLPAVAANMWDMPIGVNLSYGLIDGLSLSVLTGLALIFTSPRAPRGVVALATALFLSLFFYVSLTSANGAFLGAAIGALAVFILLPRSRLSGIWVFLTACGLFAARVLFELGRGRKTLVEGAGSLSDRVLDFLSFLQPVLPTDHPAAPFIMPVLLLGALCFALYLKGGAALGWIRNGDVLRRATPLNWALFLCALAVLAALPFLVITSMMQGRYTYLASLPIHILWIWGWSAAIAAFAGPRLRAPDTLALVGVAVALTLIGVVKVARVNEHTLSFEATLADLKQAELLQSAPPQSQLIVYTHSNASVLRANKYPYNTGDLKYIGIDVSRGWIGEERSCYVFTKPPRPNPSVADAAMGATIGQPLTIVVHDPDSGAVTPLRYGVTARAERADGGWEIARWRLMQLGLWEKPRFIATGVDLVSLEAELQERGLEDGEVAFWTQDKCSNPPRASIVGR